MGVSGHTTAARGSLAQKGGITCSPKRQRAEHLLVLRRPDGAEQDDLLDAEGFVELEKADSRSGAPPLLPKTRCSPVSSLPGRPLSATCQKPTIRTGRTRQLTD